MKKSVGQRIPEKEIAKFQFGWNIMKDKNILISMEIIIYIVMSGIDRFVYHIPNVMYIPVAILGIALILIGFFKDKSK